MTRYSLNNLKIHFSTFWRSFTIKLFVGTVNCKFHHICCVQEAITGLPKARFRRRCTHVSNLTPGGGGGYYHIWAIEVCAAVKGMVFKQFTLG